MQLEGLHKTSTLVTGNQIVVWHKHFWKVYIGQNTLVSTDIYMTPVALEMPV